MNLMPLLQDAVDSARAWAEAKLDRRWNRDPFGKDPRGTPSEYLKLFKTASSNKFPEIDAVERQTGYAIDRQWIDDLALHTQIVKKKSSLAYAHGRLLYSLLRKRIENETRITALETGTARGFSALCMAKALEDASVDGVVISVDVLPHATAMYWNCIDDADGKKSRAELLAPWSNLLERIVFMQGNTRSILPKIGVQRIHFAFLDAQHLKNSVLQEFECASAVQQKNDVVVFDDVTPATFPGVVAAIDQIEELGTYSVSRLPVSEQRGYAWAERK